MTDTAASLAKAKATIKELNIQIDKLKEEKSKALDDKFKAYFEEKQAAMNDKFNAIEQKHNAVTAELKATSRGDLLQLINEMLQEKIETLIKKITDNDQRSLNEIERYQKENRELKELIHMERENARLANVELDNLRNYANTTVKVENVEKKQERVSLNETEVRSFVEITNNFEQNGAAKTIENLKLFFKIHGVAEELVCSLVKLKGFTKNHHHVAGIDTDGDIKDFYIYLEEEDNKIKLVREENKIKKVTNFILTNDLGNIEELISLFKDNLAYNDKFISYSNEEKHRDLIASFDIKTKKDLTRKFIQDANYKKDTERWIAELRVMKEILDSVMNISKENNNKNYHNKSNNNNGNGNNNRSNNNGSSNGNGNNNNNNSNSNSTNSIRNEVRLDQQQGNQQPPQQQPQSQQLQQQQQPKRVFTCFICDQEGHAAKYCAKRQYSGSK